MKKISKSDLNGLLGFPVFTEKKLRRIVGSVFEGGLLTRSFVAHNNVTSSSQGIWTNGYFVMDDQTGAHYHTNNPILDTYSNSFGEYGIFRADEFYDANGKYREGMGLHSGRSNNPSAMTNGCIRTTDEAMDYISQKVSAGYHFTGITVQD